MARTLRARGVGRNVRARNGHIGAADRALKHVLSLSKGALLHGFPHSGNDNAAVVRGVVSIEMLRHGKDRG